MDLRIEKRQHPRVPFRYPVTILSPDGLQEGEIQNLSVDGAFIRYSEVPELDNDFQFVLRLSKHQFVLVNAAKVWSANFNFDGKTVFSGMGVRFKNMFEDDRRLLSEMIANHLERR